MRANTSPSADELRKLACLRATDLGCDLFTAMSVVVAEMMEEQLPLADLEDAESVICGEPPESRQARVIIPDVVRQQEKLAPGQRVKTLRLKAKDSSDMNRLYYLASQYSVQNNCCVSIELPDCEVCNAAEKSRCTMQ